MTDTFYGSDFAALQSFDPDVAGILLSELGRIRSGLQLIASENISGRATPMASKKAVQEKFGVSASASASAVGT